MNQLSTDFKVAVLPAMAAVMAINEMEMLLRFLVPIASGICWHFLRPWIIHLEAWYKLRKKKKP